MPLQKQPAVTLAAVCRIKICGFLHSWSYWEHSTEKWWHRTGSPPVCQRRHTDPTEIAHSLSLLTRQLPFTFLLIFRVHGPHQHGTEINQLGQEGCFCKYSIPPGLNTPLPCRACTGSERYVPVWPSAPATGSDTSAWCCLVLHLPVTLLPQLAIQLSPVAIYCSNLFHSIS